MKKTVSEEILMIRSYQNINQQDIIDIDFTQTIFGSYDNEVDSSDDDNDDYEPNTNDSNNSDSDNDESIPSLH